MIWILSFVVAKIQKSKKFFFFRISVLGIESDFSNQANA